jgi:TolA-binding protein
MKTSERHRIKRNDLATVLEGAVFFVEENVRSLVIAASAILLIAAGIYGLNRWSKSQEATASYMLGELLRIHRAPVALSLESIQDAPAGVPTFTTTEERAGRIVDLADEILSGYGSTRAAPKALYYKGVALSDMARYGDAATALNRLLYEYSEDFLAPMARFKLGWVLEAQGNPGEALTHFQTIAEDTTGLFPREEGLLGVARCLEQLGDRDQALKTYNRVVNEFPGSEYTTEARRKVDELS